MWDVTSPADTDPIRQGASVIRQMKVDLTTALDVEGVFPGANPATPVFRWKPRRGTGGARPVNDPVNPGTLYYNTDLNEWEVDTGTAWVALAHSIPSGVIHAYGGVSAPGGWLLCDGTAYSRTTYAGLFAAIGTAFGSGDGVTTFNVPDFRGRFLRGVDGAAGNDPDSGTRTAMNAGGNTGNQVGSVEADAFASHTHVVTDPGHAHKLSTPAVASGGANVTVPTGPGADIATSNVATGVTNQAAGGTETRPKNANVTYIVKI